MTTRSYWIGVIAQDHAAAGVAGGFAQLAHGRAGPLERMREGDGYTCSRRAPRGPAGIRCRRSPP